MRRKGSLNVDEKQNQNKENFTPARKVTSSDRNPSQLTPYPFPLSDSLFSFQTPPAPPLSIHPAGKRVHGQAGSRPNPSGATAERATNTSQARKHREEVRSLPSSALLLCNPPAQHAERTSDPNFLVSGPSAFYTLCALTHICLQTDKSGSRA